MTGRRRGIALAAALAALVALSALAALSTVAARIAMREAAALAEDAQAERTRAALRGRLARLASVVPRGALLEPHALGGGDTVAVATALAWPWHRLEVTAGGRTMVAEIAYASTPQIPWCAAAVTGDVAVTQPDVVWADPDEDCDSGVMRVSTSDVEDFITALVPALVPSPVPDTVVITESSTVARVFLGADVVEIVAGQEVHGLVVARVVRIGAAARVHGAVVARDSLVFGAAAVLRGDALAASQALAASARLYLVGRRGLLVSP